MYFLILIAFTLPVPGAQPQNKRDDQRSEEGRRCGFLGQWGSFHLIGSRGTAAYTVDREQFVTELRSSRSDANYWYYDTKGDPAIRQWAFSIRPDPCGLYWVWRFEGGGWHRYEATRAWGIGLGGSFAQQKTSAPTLPERVEQLEIRVDKLEKKR